MTLREKIATVWCWLFHTRSWEVTTCGPWIEVYECKKCGRAHWEELPT